MISKKKINDITVKPIPLKRINPKDVKGAELFPEIYANIYINARKKSGKTTVLYNTVKHCADQNTTVIIFCSTALKDASYTELQKMMTHKKIPFEVHTSIKDDDADHLGELLIKLEYDVSEDDNDNDDVEEKTPEIIHISDEEIRVKKKRKPKKISQKYLIIFDDISSELKDQNISKLVKQNRHYKCKVIISSQYLNDIAPMARRQMDYYILFSGMNNDKLEELFKNADLNITFDEFVEMYHIATSDKYNFYYIDSADCSFRQNFNTVLELNH